MERLIYTNPIPCSSSTKQRHGPFLPRVVGLDAYRPISILSSKAYSRRLISLSCNFQNHPFSPLAASTFQDSQSQVSVLQDGSGPKPHFVNQLVHTFSLHKKVLLVTSPIILFIYVCCKYYIFQIC